MKKIFLLPFFCLVYCLLTIISCNFGQKNLTENTQFNNSESIAANQENSFTKAGETSSGNSEGPGVTLFAGHIGGFGDLDGVAEQARINPYFIDVDFNHNIWILDLDVSYSDPDDKIKKFKLKTITPGGKVTTIDPEIYLPKVAEYSLKNYFVHDNAGNIFYLKMKEKSSTSYSIIKRNLTSVELPTNVPVKLINTNVNIAMIVGKGSLLNNIYIFDDSILYTYSLNNPDSIEFSSTKNLNKSLNPSLNQSLQFISKIAMDDSENVYLLNTPEPDSTSILYKLVIGANNVEVKDLTSSCIDGNNGINLKDFTIVDKNIYLKTSNSIYSTSTQDPITETICTKIDTMSTTGDSLISFNNMSENNGNLYLMSVDRIRKISIQDPGKQSVIGSSDSGYHDGAQNKATFGSIKSIAFNGDYMYLADSDNHTIRKINLTLELTVEGDPILGGGGEGEGQGEIISPVITPAPDPVSYPVQPVSTLAGSPFLTWYIYYGPYPSFLSTPSLNTGHVSNAVLFMPDSIAVASDEAVYVDESSSTRVRKISKSGLTETLNPIDFKPMQDVVAPPDQGRVIALPDPNSPPVMVPVGPGNASPKPIALGVYNNRVYAITKDSYYESNNNDKYWSLKISGLDLKNIDIKNTDYPQNNPYNFAVKDENTLFISSGDGSGAVPVNYTVSQVDNVTSNAPTQKSILKLSNQMTDFLKFIQSQIPKFINYQNLNISDMLSSCKNSVFGLAVNGSNLYVADTFANQILKIDLSQTNNLTTPLDAETNCQFDGVSPCQIINTKINGVQQLLMPEGIALDASGQNLYIADTGNNAIRKINLTANTMTTVAGNPSIPIPQIKLGSLKEALIALPISVAVGPNNTLFVTSLNSVLKINMGPTQ